MATDGQGLPIDDLLEQARALLSRAGRVVVLTGAGMSAESGVPTFRDAQAGWWARYRPEDLATEAAFRAQPQRVWAWYQYRRTLIAVSIPTTGTGRWPRMRSAIRAAWRWSPRT
jgi:NAD-dependent deacetylase